MLTVHVNALNHQPIQRLLIDDSSENCLWRQDQWISEPDTEAASPPASLQRRKA
jgi:hypothetical protein